MPKSVTSFHLFATGKVYMRSLVIFQCVLKKDYDEKKLVSIQRTREESDGSYSYEDTKVDYTVFPSGGTFHLHDLFLTETFGITVKFLNDQGHFSLMDGKSKVKGNDLLVFLDPARDAVSFMCHAEASPVK